MMINGQLNAPANVPKHVQAWAVKKALVKAMQQECIAFAKSLLRRTD
jgi:hypothetical protein